jgi:putative membrane protein
MQQITHEDHEAITAAIAAAEAKTSGQIVCVLSRASSDYLYVPLLCASVLALLAPWLFMMLTPWGTQKIYLWQVAIFIASSMLLSWMPLRVALVPRPLRRAQAHRAALEQFVVRRVANTKNRCGVLIFVSLAERYARIIADQGIAQKVGNAEWQAAIDALTGHMRDGRLADGFVAAIERCGGVLAAHAPSDGSANTLPDRLYVM